jgi:hypothetical protein
VGGLDQVALESGEDLRRLGELDPKLWVALSCPTRGLELDRRTLALLDTDGDGRVRVPEVLAAIRFCEARLKTLDVLVPGADGLRLADLDEGTPEGRATLGAARRILASLGRGDAAELVAADVTDTSKVFEGTRFNGDGVVPPEAAEVPAVRQVIADAMACTGAVPDLSGRPGLSRPRLEAFFAELTAFDEAWTRAEATAGVMPLGPGTPAAHAALAAVRAKIDDFFVRCGVAAMEPRAAAALNRSDPEYAALAARDLSTAADVAAFPIARVEPGRALPLADGVNPAWSDALAAFRRDCVAPALGADRAALSAADWAGLKERFAAYGAWRASRPGGAVEGLGLLRVRALLAGGARAAIEALLAQDEALAAETKAIGDVVRLVHYRRDLHTLLRNFVSFADFYDPARRAVFQAGTLYVDGRSCELCVRVDDAAANAALAATSRMCLAYCDCRRPDGETMRIAACVTQGDSDYLVAGRNGVFWDRRGRDWDATIVRLVDNPISIRQAFWAPYKKFIRLIEEQTLKLAAAREKAVDERLSKTAGQVAAAAGGVEPPAEKPVDVARMVGIIAALGVGIGALGTVFGGFVAGFTALQPWWAKLLAVAGMVLLVSGPSMLVAWLKLRQRTLGPILDSTGWAVNGRVKVNLPLGAALTQLAALPAGSRRSLDDPFEDRRARRRRRLLWLLAALVAAAAIAARLTHTWPYAR